MPYPAIALISVIIFALVHLFARSTRGLNKRTHGRFLSAGGGVAIAYVFVDLLPKLCDSNVVVEQALAGVFPYFERHVFVMALVGFLLFFFVNQSHTLFKKENAFWVSFASYALFNFMVGYAVVDKDDPDVQPLALFTFALALHYFVNDYTLNKEHGKIYNHVGKWVLVVSLFLGWLVGVWITLPAAGIALVGAFIAGGVIMNVIRHELPADNPHSLSAFMLSALGYTVVLLSIGA